MLPFVVHVVPTLPVVQVPWTVHWLSSVQLVELGCPALHLLTTPQRGFTPFAVHAAPLLAPLVQLPLTLQVALTVQDVVEG